MKNYGVEYEGASYREEEEYNGSSIADPCIVVKIDGTYDARSIRHGLRCNAMTRDGAMAKLDQLMSGAFV